jgi:Transcriptional Coactivator p15 (PC4)
MSGADNGQLVAIIPKNARERIEVRLREYEGHPFVDLRVFYEDGTEFKPTRKGIGFRPGLLLAVIEALRSAEAAARAARLLK